MIKTDKIKRLEKELSRLQKGGSSETAWLEWKERDLTYLVNKELAFRKARRGGFWAKFWYDWKYSAMR